MASPRGGTVCILAAGFCVVDGTALDTALAADTVAASQWLLLGAMPAMLAGQGRLQGRDEERAPVFEFLEFLARKIARKCTPSWAGSPRRLLRWFRSCAPAACPKRLESAKYVSVMLTYLLAVAGRFCGQQEAERCAN